MEQEPPYQVARKFSPGDLTPALPCLSCRALRRFEVVSAAWEKKWSDVGYSRVEREGEVIVTGKPPFDGAAYFYEDWMIEAQCVACGLRIKLRRSYCDAENFYCWDIPPEKYGVSDGRQDYWQLVEDYDVYQKYYCYLRDPSDFDLEITDENRWLKNLADEIDAELNKKT